MTIELVYTERRRDLTDDRARKLGRLRERLDELVPGGIEVSHYEDVDAGRLARADAVVLSGSVAAWSSRNVGELARLGEAVLATDRPVLGICAGMQLLTRFAGGGIDFGGSVEHGFLPIRIHGAKGLLRGLPEDAVVFHDHTDEIVDLPDGFEVLASSDACAIQALVNPARRWWGTQFHPEQSSAEHPDGVRVLRNFLELAS